MNNVNTGNISVADMLKLKDLQEVANLKPSKYMIELAKENMQNKKNYKQVEDDIKTYYDSQSTPNLDEKEADEVSLRIVKILNVQSFSFNYITYREYHKLLFV